MSHVLSWPTMTSPSNAVTLNPALVTIQEAANLRPVQRVLRAADGTRWVFQLSDHRLQTFRVTVDRLHEADVGGFSGYASLANFIDVSANYAMNQFDLTHTDGITTPVYFSSEMWTFEEVVYGFWSGTFDLERVV